jgi:hypothetical protein
LEEASCFQRADIIAFALTMEHDHFAYNNSCHNAIIYDDLACLAILQLDPQWDSQRMTEFAAKNNKQIAFFC